MRHSWKLVLFLSLLLGCPADPAPPTPTGRVQPSGEPTPAPSGLGVLGEGPSAVLTGTAFDLKSHFSDLQAALAGGDVPAAARLSRALYPTPERIRVALAASTPPELRAAIERFHEAERPAEDDEAAWARLFRTAPERTEVRVHGARGAAIAAGSAPAFPGGAVEAAGSLLAPQVRFYQVEVVEPGAMRGMTLHLFFWDGAEWCMLGPVWRALRKGGR